MQIAHRLLDRILPTVTMPARYTGGEWNSVVKDWDAAQVRLVLAYPDVYQVGMSNLGLMILYDVVNRQPGFLAERAYAPWVDMETAMRQAGIPLYSLESRHPLREFDVLGFTLPYELNFSNVLNMLDLTGLPVLAAERGENWPLVIGGGVGAVNAEPLADFFDAFAIGDGEEVILEILNACAQAKKSGAGKPELLRALAGIPGVYVPGLYQVMYRDDGTVAAVTPAAPEASPRIVRRIVPQLPPPPVDLGISRKTLDFIRDAMRLVAVRGTARPRPELNLDLVPFKVAGKTGTAQVGKRSLDHAWFAGFLPYDAPRLAFAVFVESCGRHGGEAAAPILQRLLEQPECAAFLEGEGP